MQDTGHQTPDTGYPKSCVLCPESYVLNPESYVQISVPAIPPFPNAR